MTAAGAAARGAGGPSTAPPPAEVEVAVLGAGFSGLAAAAELLRVGCRSLAVLERADRVGGTWRDNTYPGCACDVPSALYSLSFAPEPSWSRAYAPAGEIQDYLERVADSAGVRPYLHLGCKVLESHWDADAARWQLTTTAGPVSARFLVVAPGPLAEPSVPDVPGLEDFAGPVWHSARWRHDVDLAGLRVAVVGTGASAIQVVPGVVDDVAGLVLLQRTPAWVMPRRDRERPEWEQRLSARVPPVLAAQRQAQYWRRDLTLGSFRHDGPLRRLAEATARAHLRRQVPDPDLRARLTPDYRLGCKRVLLSDDYYPALARPHVTVAPALARVEAGAVVDAAGTRHPVDAVVFATGFHVTDLPAAATTFGRDGTSLEKAWDGHPQAYRGVAVAGFPNLFLLLGPGTGLGHSSVVLMAEAQVRYAVRTMLATRRYGAEVVEVRPEAQAAWDAAVQHDLAGTVWTSGGCRSWYQDATGQVAAIWPRTVTAYRRAMARADVGAYTFGRGPVALPAPEQEQAGLADPGQPAGPPPPGQRRRSLGLRTPPGGAQAPAVPAVRVEPVSFVTDDGVRLAGEAAGPHDAPATAVLVHGWTQDRRTWGLVLPRLAAAGLHVVAYDLRGHGQSQQGPPGADTIDRLADDLAEVLAQVPGRVLLAGHSMGGMTIMALAARHPDLVRGRVAAVALVATSAGQLARRSYGLPLSTGRLLQEALPRVLARASAAEAAGAPRRTLPKGYLVSLPPGADPYVRAVVQDMLTSAGAGVVERFYLDLMRHDRASALPVLADLPAAVLVGSRDLLTPPVHARRLADALPGCALRVFGGCGHMLPLEQPADVSAALLALLRAGLAGEPATAAAAGLAGPAPTGPAP